MAVSFRYLKGDFQFALLCTRALRGMCAADNLCVYYECAGANDKSFCVTAAKSGIRASV
jgi:hypothetical protein